MDVDLHIGYVKTQTHALTPSPSPSATANPPATTRPPPLNLPTRPAEADTSPKAKFSHLFATGVAYLKFYKTGVKHIYTNTRLLYSSSSATKDPELAAARPAPGTRAHFLLRLRWRYDVRRLPLFAVILVVCGEFTPLVVLALPRAVPGPCRIPRQVEGLLRGVERGGGRLGRWRRRRLRRRLGGIKKGGGWERGRGGGGGERGARILGLSARAWTPGFLVRKRVAERLGYLREDDALLVEAGGAKGLVDEEVRLACADRGVDVLGREVEELRSVLGRWLRLTNARRLGEEGREKAVTRLLLAKDSEWEG
ncbi:hypothetical protein NEMBOFW57_003839 [Staphylotrichum longicolle]|uniref:Letm1 RBD domain-containing protein n=1 Tax=Staphylotrichum longicolle TaxID=669026 RepID=A0AAD4F8K9_9PEZI|nr:hypothetical protein NEMBOFW57_003839 [Staphylotrichum longicolle]